MTKRLLILFGNILPPPINKFFYFFGGVKFQDIKSCWIGMNCFIDSKNPNGINIGKNVCISYKVTFINHFDPSRVIKNHPIKKKFGKIEIKNNVFIGANSVIMPNVIIEKGTFIMPGSIVNKDTKPFDIIYGPQSKSNGSLLRFKSYKKYKSFFEDQ